MWHFGPADGVVVAQLAQCSPPTAFFPVSNSIQRLCCNYSWAVSYPQCVCHLLYLRKALTWSIPFKLGLFFPSLDPQVSIAVSSLWHLHPFFHAISRVIMHSSDNLKARGPTTTAAMIPTRTHPPPITAITNPPIFPQNPLARRQANDPRLCGYINGDPGTSPQPSSPPPHLHPSQPHQ